MRTASRYYIVDDDGAIRHLARATFNRIILQLTCSPFADLAGKRVRLAQITVQLDGRKALAVQRASFTYLTFDANGLFDPAEWEDAARATIESWPSPAKPHNSPVIKAAHRFVDRRGALEYDWQPTDELRRELFAKATHHPRPHTPKNKRQLDRR